MKHGRTGANHIILTKRIKLQLKRYHMQRVQNLGFEQTFTEFIEIFVL